MTKKEFFRLRAGTLILDSFEDFYIVMKSSPECWVELFRCRDQRAMRIESLWSDYEGWKYARYIVKSKFKS